ncbi:MAG: DNA-protecting protein DprA, partial [Proteobacteria bacterium]|nr:DNA-protecting protein DprA [Pseudomonadota bacterium]
MLFEAQPAHKTLLGQNLTDVLRLIRSPQVGPVTFFMLLRRYGSAAEALQRLPQLAKAGGRKTPLEAAPLADIAQEIEQTHALGARFVMYGEEDYPPLLLTVPDAP